MAKIKQIVARELLNARGFPAIEVTVLLSDGVTGIASCPSGTSIGGYEAVNLVDKDPLRYKGMGVLHALQTIQTVIAPKLVGMDSQKQAEIDKTLIELDGTQNKSHLGTNTTLAVSMAVAKASAASAIMPLFLYLKQLSPQNTLKIPKPLFTVLSGGKQVQNAFDFQEFLIIPASSSSWADALYAGVTITQGLADVLKTNGFSILTGPMGAFAPHLSTNHDGYALISQAIESTNYRLGFDIFLGTDVAANFLYQNGQYRIKDKAQALSNKTLIEYYLELTKQFHSIYWEDLCSEEDWDGWSSAVTRLSQDALVVGDDLIATNPYRLQMGIDKKAITGVVIKPHQIGTVIESLAVAEMARLAGLKTIVSQRSNETNDTFIADFAVAIGADYCKFGAPLGGEHVAKYNRLSQIDSQLKTLKQ